MMKRSLTAGFSNENKKENENELATSSKDELSKNYMYYPKPMVDLINSDKFIAKILK